MTSDEPLRRTPLHELHAEAGARFMPFAGWTMPLQYSGIVSEHRAVRERAGVFDVSHMGRVRVEGARATERLRAATTYDVTQLASGDAHYTLYCTEAGGIADDLFVYRLDEQRWLVVHNAENARSDLDHLLRLDAPAEDVTEMTVMLAVQGPEARTAVGGILGETVTRIAPRRCVQVSWDDSELVVARTGYTGEDGFEVIAPIQQGIALWERLIGTGVGPAGLGARDTLRLEAALPLHGHDIDWSTNPFEAGLAWVVTLEDGVDFAGRDALVQLHDREPERRLSCIRLNEPGVPRAEAPVIDPETGQRIATLTSGTFSPTLRTGIGLAYLPADRREPGTKLEVQIRDRGVHAEVVRRPFYRRAAA